MPQKKLNQKEIPGVPTLSRSEKFQYREKPYIYIDIDFEIPVSPIIDTGFDLTLIIQGCSFIDKHLKLPLSPTITQLPIAKQMKVVSDIVKSHYIQNSGCLKFLFSGDEWETKEIREYHYHFSNTQTYAFLNDGEFKGIIFN